MTTPSGLTRRQAEINAEFEQLMAAAQAEEWWDAFDTWCQSIPNNVLSCRVGRHDWPDWADNKRTDVYRLPNGHYIVQAKCKRKCGVALTRFVSPDGFLERSNRITHDYSEAIAAARDPNKGYLIPPGARSGHGLTKAQNARLRKEVIERNSDWITELGDESSIIPGRR